MTWFLYLYPLVPYFASRVMFSRTESGKISQETQVHTLQPLFSEAPLGPSLPPYLIPISQTPHAGCWRCMLAPASNCILFQLLFFFKIIFFREREKERESSTDVREKHRSVASYMPPAENQVCALTGNRTGNLLVCRRMPTLLSHTSQGMF